MATSTLYTSTTRPGQPLDAPTSAGTTSGTQGRSWPPQTGATLAELMGRLGHSTPGAALRYQHAAQGRDRAIADALSKLAKTSSVTDKVVT